MSNLLKRENILSLDDTYENFKDSLPPLDELKVFHVENIKEFNSPDAWILEECLRILLQEEKCDPNVMDNYGEILLNMAIQTFKTQSIQYILNSGNIRINDVNEKGISPIG